MDEELKRYLETKFAALDMKFAAIDLKFDALDERLTNVEHTLRAEIEASETRLLSEFWKWGRTNDQRMRRLDLSDATTVDRMTNLEDRVFALEREKAKHSDQTRVSQRRPPLSGSDLAAR